MTDLSAIAIDGEPYAISYDSPLPSGKRGIEWRTREAQRSDPARTREVTWKTSGPIGRSRQGPDGFLGVDYTTGLDTSLDDSLAPGAQRIAINADALDSGGTGTLFPFKFGSLLGGSAVGDVTDMLVERNQRLFMVRGAAHTFVRTSDLTVEGTTLRPAPIAGQAKWRGKVAVSYDASHVMQTVDGIEGGVALYGNTSEYVGAQAVGSDRWWGIEALSGDIFYALDKFVTFSNTFVVGDPGERATGIHTIGPFAIVGRETGAWSFTDAGRSVLLTESFKDHPSVDNARKAASIWGWLYLATEVGVVAILPNTGIESQVGPESIPGFTGPADGTPTAVGVYKGMLWLAIDGTDGALWLLFGTFNRQFTEATGRPDWHVFARIESVSCRAIAGMKRGSNPTVVIAENRVAGAYTLGRGRNRLDPNYRYRAATEDWYGTTLTVDPALKKFLRAIYVKTKNCDASNYWQPAVSFDGGAYLDVGTPITGNGLQVARPVAAGVPLPTAVGTEIKPRLRCTSANTVTPPEIVGDLVLVYDERPEQVREYGAVLRMDVGNGTDLRRLEKLEAAAALEQPVLVRIPGESKDRYGLITSVEGRDAAGNATQAATVRLTLWEHN